MGDMETRGVPDGATTPPSKSVAPQKASPIADPVATSPPPAGSVAPQDQLDLSTGGTGDKGKVPSAAYQIRFDEPTVSPPPRSKDDPPARYFLRVGAGLHVNEYSKSDIRLVQPAYNTNVTLHGVSAVQRTSFSYLYDWPAGYPQVDEAQNTVKVAFGDRQTNWGVEVGLDHHKYVVNNWDKQVVHGTGTLAGKPVDQDIALKDIGWKYEHTNGLNRISVKAVKSFHLPAPKHDSFKFNTKLGPDAFVLFTKAHIYDQHGGTDETYGPYHLGGYGATWENSLEYSFRNKAYLEIFHALTYANLPDVRIAKGHAEQTFWISQFGFTVGRYFNLRPKPQPVVEP